jgi:hypothetical protein
VHNNRVLIFNRNEALTNTTRDLLLQEKKISNETGGLLQQLLQHVLQQLLQHVLQQLFQHNVATTITTKHVTTIGI